MRITILGTSSAIPTFKRSLSSTLLERNGQAFLFDCGEGTQFQLMRAGVKRGHIGEILITHLHGDHFYGLPGLLSSMSLNQRETPLRIWGPEGIKQYIHNTLSFPRRMRLPFELEVEEIESYYEGSLFENDEYIVSTTPLDHRVPTQGYRFQEKDRPGVFDAERADALRVPFGPERARLIRGESLELADGTIVTPDQIVGEPQPGKSFVYCTDTGFCLAAKRLAQGCDLLYHETTYGDEFMEMAFERKHSTMRQAAIVAKAAGVKRLVASHFSTRYDKSKIPALKAEGCEVLGELTVAQDLMQLEV